MFRREARKKRRFLLICRTTRNPSNRKHGCTPAKARVFPAADTLKQDLAFFSGRRGRTNILFLRGLTMGSNENTHSAWDSSESGACKRFRSAIARSEHLEPRPRTNKNRDLSDLRQARLPTANKSSITSPIGLSLLEGIYKQGRQYNSRTG